MREAQDGASVRDVLMERSLEPGEVYKFTTGDGREIVARLQVDENISLPFVLEEGNGVTSTHQNLDQFKKIERVSEEGKDAFLASLESGGEDWEYL